MHIRLAKVLNDDAVCITSVAINAINLCVITAIQCGVDRVDMDCFELLGCCCHFVSFVVCHILIVPDRWLPVNPSCQTSISCRIRSANLTLCSLAIRFRMITSRCPFSRDLIACSLQLSTSACLASSSICWK